MNIYVTQEGKIGPLIKSRLQSALGQQALRCATNRMRPKSEDLIVAVSDFYGFDFLLRWQGIARFWKTRLFCVHIHGDEAVIGPEVDSAQPGCLRCWFTRYYACRNLGKQFAQISSFAEPSSIDDSCRPTPLAQSVISEIAASRIFATLDRSKRAKSAAVEVYYWDLNTLTGRPSRILPDPTCRGCSQLPFDSPQAAEVNIASRLKPLPSVDRLRSLEELEPEVRDAFTGRRGGLAAEVNIAWKLTHGAVAISTIPLLDNKPESCGGFSDRYSSARTMSVLEALERYAGIQMRCRQTSVRGTFSFFKNVALDPRCFGLYSDEAYKANPEQITPYHDDLEMEFVWAYSFRKREPVLIPRQLGFYSQRDSGRLPFVLENSNGCALGSSPEEAILHGIFEVVERDAFLLTWYAQLQRPQIDPMESPDPEIRCRCRRLEEENFELAVMDATTDFGIPALWVLARRRNRQIPFAAAIAAAHIRPQQALCKALRELDNSINRRTIEMQDEEKLRRAGHLTQNPSQVRTMRDHPMFYCMPESAPCLDFLTRSNERSSLKAMAAYSQELCSADLGKELQAVIDKILATGSDVVAVKQTTPEQVPLGLHTYKVLIPGAIPMSWGSNLRRVVGLSRLDAALQAASLPAPNAAPHPFD